MRDIKLDIRMELFRVQPKLCAQQGEEMIEDIPRCFRDVTRDNAACGQTEWHDFYNFSLFHGVALVTIYRKAEIEFVIFVADESLIQMTDHMAMVDVDEFLQTVRSRFHVPDSGLRFPMAEVLPWLESEEAV